MERARNHVLEGCGSLLPQDHKYSQKTNKPEPVLSPSDMEAFLDHRPAVCTHAEARIHQLFLITGQPCQLWMRCLLFLTSILFWQIDVSALRNVDMKTTSFAHISPHVLIILPHDTPSIIFYCFRQKKMHTARRSKKIDNNI
jgi:hypothetical protein